MNTVFKKYYCPNCGVQEFSLLDKCLMGPRQSFNTPKCTACRNRISYKTQPIVIILYILFGLSVALTIIFKQIPAALCIIVIFIIYFLYLISCVLAIKFSRAEDYCYQDKVLVCNIDLNDEIKSPKGYFNRTAVVMLDFEKIDYFAPAWIEPIKINEKHCECKVAFIGDDDIDDFKDKPFIVSDNYVEVGTGQFET